MRTLLLFCFLIGCSTVNAQHEYDNWYFGDSCAISFASGYPVNLPNGSLVTQEGCSSISDSSGNLLFYTNGINVWNANNTQMPNGFGLFGDNSSTQSALIVKDPGNLYEYYIFTTAAQGGQNGMCYSKVNMSLDGGLGDVTDKNIQLITPCDEKLAAIRNNGNDFWVVAHQPNLYYAFPVTNTGVGSAVISNVGITNTASNPQIGHLKISPDGQHIVQCLNKMRAIEIADFDISTGVVTNPFVYYSTIISIQSLYTAEFSASGNVLYFQIGASYSAYPSFIFQTNLLAGDSTAILNSTQLIYIDSVNCGGAMQLAPDNKIYTSHYLKNYLGVINFPDSIGNACNYVDTGFVINEQCRLGLPNAIAGGLISNNSSPIAAMTSENNICESSCVSLINQSINANSYQWTFPGGTPTTSTEINPTVCYSTAGSYDVTLISSNASGSDTLTLINYITVNPSPSPPIIMQSNDTLYSSLASSYQWFQDSVLISGATNPFYIPTSNGTYSVEITDSLGCTATNSFEFYLQPQASIQPITTKVCPDSCIAFGNNSVNASSYEWFFDGGSPSYSTDSFPQNICYSTSGLYDVTLIVHNGPYSDTSVITNLIEVYASPSPNITQSNDTLYANNSLTGSTYQWYHDNTIISNATNPFYIPTQNGNYSVIVTSGNGCTASDDLQVVNVGIENVLGENDFEIFPNPADESVTIRLGRNQNAELKLYNTLGQLLRNDFLQGGQVLKWSGSTWAPANSDVNTDAQTLNLSTNTLSISNGNSVTLPAYTAGSGITINGSNVISATDNSTTNEIQTLGLSGNILSLSSGGGSVTLPTGTTYTAGTGISISSGVISNTGDNDNNSTNEIQSLSLSGNTLSISGSNNVVLPTSTDAQTLSISGSTLSILNGNSISIPSSADNWGSQTAVTNATLTGNGVAGTPLGIAQQSATNGQVLKWNGSTWAPAADTDTNTDAQTLSISGNVLTISGGNNVTLPSSTFSLPYSSTTNSASTLFDITNSGSGSSGRFNISSTGNTNHALKGETSGKGFGVYGYSNFNAFTNTSAGVFGSYSANTFGAGVAGVGFNGIAIPDSIDVGVFGSSEVSGIYGITTFGKGVYGNATSDYGIGVLGYNSYDAGVNGIGVYGTYDLENSFGSGLVGIAWGGFDPTISVDYGVWASGGGAAGYAVYADGNLTTTGAKNASVGTSKGNQLLYSIESPEVWFEDFGHGTLVNGETTINLDQLFLETVFIDDEHPMIVTVTPEGDCKGLYVVPGKTSFTVKELGGGTSNVSFSFRITCKRNNYQDHKFGSDLAGGNGDTRAKYHYIIPRPIDYNAARKLADSEKHNTALPSRSGNRFGISRKK